MHADIIQENNLTSTWLASTSTSTKYPISAISLITYTVLAGTLNHAQSINQSMFLPPYFNFVYGVAAFYRYFCAWMQCVIDLINYYLQCMLSIYLSITCWDVWRLVSPVYNIWVWQ